MKRNFFSCHEIDEIVDELFFILQQEGCNTLTNYWPEILTQRPLRIGENP